MTSAVAAPAASRRGIFAWCLFDWANSAFPTAVTTFVFSAYVTKAVAPTPEIGTAAWGNAMALAAIVVALLSPALGAIADHSGPRKPWIAAFTALAAVASAGLWFVVPEQSALALALVLVVLATLGFEFGQVFYNAMLPDLAPADMVGRISGWAWGLGYAGGLGSLLLCLVVFVQADPPPFGLDPESAEHVRATGPVVALWFALFALPMFLLTPDRARSGLAIGAAARAGLRSLAQTARQIRRYGNILRFLIARMLYTDGLNTLFAFGGIYAAGSFGMEVAEVIQFGIALNVTAGLGAAGFAFLDDRIGAKPVIIIALVALIVLGGLALVVTSKTQFWLVGLGLGIFVGPAQAASRSLMARLAPEHLRAEFFGLFALSGKATAFLGPALLGWTTLAFDSQRAGMATILLFLVLGLVLFLKVVEPARDAPES